MNKKQIDKMVRVDFCNNQEYKAKLYDKYGHNKKEEEVKEQPVKDYYPDY
tara:strand:+ start:50 stop:199 length:150 start_codon:yes stop_codon:yes gene_type:complete